MAKLLNKPSKQDIARAVRRLLREGASGALATVSARDGAPANALVTFATDGRARPLFLFSTLSEHTRNLAGDARASLLIEAASGRRNPQTGPRAALSGTVRKVRDPLVRARFLARHPDAALYAGFGDFAFYRMTVEKAHYVGGFAAAHWVKGRDVLLSPEPANAIAAIETDIITHMNTAHADAVDLYANVPAGRKGRGWRLAGIDAEGCDLWNAGRRARLWFPEPLAAAADARPMLIKLAKQARTGAKTGAKAGA